MEELENTILRLLNETKGEAGMNTVDGRCLEPEMFFKAFFFTLRPSVSDAFYREVVIVSVGFVVVSRRESSPCGSPCVNDRGHKSDGNTEK